MRHSVTALLKFRNREPSLAYIELVEILYTTMVPVVVVGILLASIGCLIAVETRDVSIAILTAAVVIVTLVRALNNVMFQHRRKQVELDTLASRYWERRYAVGSFVFAGLLGALNARALSLGAPLVPVLATGIIFGYASGLVARISVRPVICVISLLIAVVPTVATLPVYVGHADTFYGKATYIMLMILLSGFTFISLETVRHIYTHVLQSLITKRDLMALAGQDPLTGLPNRIVLRSRLDESVARIERTGGLMALHCLDLDRFKFVNDTLGHPAGDLLLQAVSQRITGILQSGDTVARLGGDEFVVVQVGIKSRDEAAALAGRISRVVSEPYSLSGEKADVGVSIGIAVAPRDGQDMEQLINCADEALYAAKRAGRGAIRFFTESIDEMPHSVE